MAQYKALVGTIVYKTESADGYFTAELSAESEGCELPEIVLGVEMVLLVNLIRKATKKNIVPHKVTVKRPFDNPGYEKFLGVKAETGEKNALIFTERDAHVPFVTHNESMWNFFEPELRKLKEENTSFQQQLNHTRELLTKNYLRNTRLSSEDIAYLLGYQDLNSFYRAFSLWTGKSITEYKAEAAK